jgi:hypothetical protein
VKAHQILSDPSKWTKGGYARTAAGENCFWDNPDACPWCAVGAIALCYPDPNKYSEARAKWHPLMKQRYPNMTLDSVNDVLGYEAVVGLLRDANV